MMNEQLSIPSLLIVHYPSSHCHEKKHCGNISNVVKERIRLKSYNNF